jgi:ribosomal protein S18 acetylase RimI-like enzyme
MTARVFTPSYLERAKLADGTAVHLRLLAPGDKELLREGFERLSPESRYARFLAPKVRLTDDELHYLCDIDQESHFALGAVLEGGDRHGHPVGVGIARFIRLPDVEGRPVTAEPAVAVADELQGQGLGRLLLDRLVAAARERGIERFHCEVLGSNESMRALLDRVPSEHKREVRSGVVSIDFPLPGLPPEAPPPRESSLYQFFRAAAQNAIEWTEAVRRLWRR